VLFAGVHPGSGGFPRTLAAIDLASELR